MAETTILPRSRIIKVSFEIALPADATLDEIEKWVCFEMNTGGIANANPLLNHDLTSISDPDLEDTEMHLHYSVANVKDTPGGGKSYTLHRPRKREPYLGPSESELVRNAPSSSPGGE